LHDRIDPIRSLFAKIANLSLDLLRIENAENHFVIYPEFSELLEV